MRVLRLDSQLYMDPQLLPMYVYTEHGHVIAQQLWSKFSFFPKQRMSGKHASVADMVITQSVSSTRM